MQKVRKYDLNIENINLTEKTLRSFDCVLLLTDHDEFPYELIKNNSNDIIKLISRHWKIFDSNGSYREVRGKGVVGEQPVIHPGHEFEYTSGTPLKTSSGLMHGSYQMEDFKGKSFEVLIPPFSLDAPNNNIKLN